MNDKFTVFPGAGKKDANRDAIRKFRENIPIIIEHQLLMAQLHKAKFDALKAEGFDDAQALELCKVLL